MLITHDASLKRFVFCGTFEEREVPKSARFQWDSARRQWWTGNHEQANELRCIADNTAIAAIDDLRGEAAVQIAASSAKDAAIDIPCPEGLAYMPFQKAGVAYALARPACLIADSMGLGKTIQAIGIINADPSISRVLVVCPASLKINWQREMEKWLVPAMCIAILDAKTCDQGEDVLVVNYDILTRLPWLPEIEFDLVILDEGQKIKSFAAARTKATHRLRGRRRLILTGTPILNRPVELFSLLNWLDPITWPSFWSFTMRYCAAWDAPWGRDTSGASNMPELNRLLRSTLMVRRLKEDVMPELPAKRRQLVELPVNGSNARRTVERELNAWDTHEALQAKLRALMEAHAPSCPEEAYRAQVAALRASIRVAFEDMARLRHETATYKIPQVIDHLRGCLETDEKIVCFAWHHDVIDAIMEDFPGISVRLDGRMNMTDRQRSVDRFQQPDGNIRLFVGNIQAAGVGLTLTASSHAVFAELDWVPGNVSQAEDRCILEGELILTPGGWRPIEQIEIGDEVIASSGTSRKVLDRWNRGNQKVMAEIEVTGWPWPIKTTHDHKFMTPTGWRQAQDLRPGDEVSMPVCEFERTESIAFDGARVPSSFKGAWGLQKNGRLIHAPETIPLDDTALFVFGYFAGNGYTAVGKNKGRFVGFAAHEKKTPHLDIISEWFSRWGVKSTPRKDPGGLGIDMHCFNSEWAFWFRQHFGESAHTKRLPIFLMRLSRPQARHLLSGLMCSDGYSRKGRHEYVTISFDLAAQVAMIIRASGYRPCLTRAKLAGTWVVAYTEGIEDGTCKVRSVLLRHPRKVGERREKVFDLMVEKEGSFVVGMSVVHNCHRIGQRDSVLIQHLVLEGSLDCRMVKTIIDKQDTIDEAVGESHDGN